MKKPRCETCEWMSEKMNKWDGTAYLGKFNYTEVYRCQIRAPHPKYGFAETTPEGFCGEHSDFNEAAGCKVVVPGMMITQINNQDVESK